jgi:hypothetical protein
MDKDPNLAKAPLYIRDELLFPYLAGTGFTQEFLKAHSGWQDLHLIFQNPPVSTQQIIHPDLYLHGVKPEVVPLPEWKGVVPSDWKLLEENAMGEFGVEEILKQLLDENRAELLAPSWKGDRYAVFEDAKTKSIIQTTRRISSASTARPWNTNTNRARSFFAVLVFSSFSPNPAEFSCAASRRTASAWKAQRAKRSTKSITPSVGSRRRRL